MLLLIHGVAALLFVVLGVVFMCGKGSKLTEYGIILAMMEQ